MLSLIQVFHRWCRFSPLTACVVAASAGCGSPGAEVPVAGAPVSHASTNASPADSGSGSAAAMTRLKSPSAADTAAASSASAPAPLPGGTRVLHIGDSFAGALGYDLSRALKPHNVQTILRYEKSTYIPTWAWGKELPRYLADYQPGLVLVTLGGNELKIPDPQKRAATIQRLVSKLGNRPCVWIGIPLWEGADPTLMEVVRSNVAPCLYFDSAAQLPDLERAGDGIHPSTAARARWARTVVEWLQRRVEPGAKWKWRALR